ncbi:MAG: D-alanine--D-alanine ligase [Candidatus Omnitrophota bacterium]
MRTKIIIAAGMEDKARVDVEDVLRCAESVKEAMGNLGIESREFFLHPEDFTAGEDSLKERIRKSDADCVFNLFEGFSADSAKEIKFARLLEEMKIPFTGNASRALEICRNKEKTKKILRQNGVNVPEGLAITTVDDLAGLDPEYPVFIKPCCEDASVGIDRNSFAEDGTQLGKAVADKLKDFPEGLIVEEFIPGREYNAGYFGAYPYVSAGISMIDYNDYPGCPVFMSFTAKWDTGTDEFHKLVPVVVKGDMLQEGIKSTIHEVSRKTAGVLGCSGYFRVDLREKNGKIYVLDINPNPDINRDSGFTRQAYAAGLTYEEMISRIINPLLDGKRRK